MHGVFMPVGEDLDFDMARLLEVFLEVDHGIAERGLGLGASQGHRVEQRRFGVHDAHAPSAAAPGGLDDHRIADLARDAHDLLVVLGQRAVRPRNRGHTDLRHRLLGTHLVAHQADILRMRADEYEARALDLLGEIGVLREKAVARVNGLRTGGARCGQDRRAIEIALDAMRLIGEPDMARVAVGIGVQRDAAQAQAARAADDAAGDLAAVRDQQAREHLSSFREPRRACASRGTRRCLPCLPARRGSRRCAARSR